MNSGELMIVLIVLISVAGGIIRAKLGVPQRNCRDNRGRRDYRQDWSDADPALREENARLHDELRTLKSRVATLERIATDSSTSLDREIEALRDRP